MALPSSLELLSPEKAQLQLELCRLYQEVKLPLSNAEFTVTALQAQEGPYSLKPRSSGPGRCCTWKCLATSSLGEKPCFVVIADFRSAHTPDHG